MMGTLTPSPALAQVTIFADREAVRIGDEGHPLLIYGDSDLDELLSSFLAGGGSVLVALC